MLYIAQWVGNGGVIVNKIYKVNWFSSVLFHAERVEGYTAQNIMDFKKKNWLWMTGRLCVMYTSVDFKCFKTFLSEKFDYILNNIPPSMQDPRLWWVGG